ncbi:MAG: flagellar motor switch protein FliG [Pseudomonadota bacterium]
MAGLEQAQLSARDAAVLLLALGEAEAATVLKHLDAKVVQRLGAEMAQIKSASREEVSGMLGNFVSVMDGQSGIKAGSDEYIRRVLVNALGDDKASSIIDRVLQGQASKGLDALKWMEPRAIADIIRHEHPQVLSIVLAYLDTDQAAKVLEFFPDFLQADIVMRIATLEGVHPAALGKLDEMMEKQFAGNSGASAANLGGPKSAAGILNFINAGVLEQIRKADEALGQKLQDLMFVFENMMDVDDRGIQELLREVDSAKLVIALKGADPGLTEKFLKNMSQRAAETLKEDLESKGPVRLVEVESAQKEILGVARRLADEGKIALGGATGEVYV